MVFTVGDLIDGGGGQLECLSDNGEWKGISTAQNLQRKLFW